MIKILKILFLFKKKKEFRFTGKRQTETSASLWSKEENILKKILAQMSEEKKPSCFYLLDWKAAKLTLQKISSETF